MGVDDLINAGSLVNLPITDFALTSVPAGFTESLSLHGNSLDPNVAAVPGPPIGGQLAAGSGLLGWSASAAGGSSEAPSRSIGPEATPATAFPSGQLGGEKSWRREFHKVSRRLSDRRENLKYCKYGVFVAIIMILK